MTPERQRIKIAELCGLFHIRPLRRTTRRGKEDPEGVVLWYCDEDHGGAASYRQLPDYLKDLNAMNEAETYAFENLCLSSSSFQTEYAVQLRRVLSCHSQDVLAFARASAAQRAEAFLRTMGAWEE